MNLEFQKTISIEGKKLVVNCDVDVSVHTEMYGEDADGNRGMLTTFAEVDNILIKDGRGNDIAEKLDDAYPDEMEKIINHAEEKALNEKGE